jgi:Protein of unknown function (DUF2750)
MDQPVIDDQEFESVRALTPLERYDHFVGRVIDWGVIFTLGDDAEMGVIEDPSGVRYVNLWPHAPYAEAERERDWEKYEVLSFELDEWLDRLLPDMAERGLSVGVFPVWDHGAWVMGADELVTELRAAISETYGDDD